MSDIYLTLCSKNSNKINLYLSEEFPDWRKDGIEGSVSLVSESEYEGFELCITTDITDAKVYINDDLIGYFYKSSKGLQFCPNSNSNSAFFLPFLTYFGYIFIRVDINYENTTKTLYTKYLNVGSKNQEYNNNAKLLLEQLEKYNDSILGDWVFNQFPSNQKNIKHSFWLGSLRPKRGRYLEAYIELLKSIMNIYRKNFCFYKVNAYHKIEYQKKIISYEKIRRCTRNDFQWLMQNTDCFASINKNIGIKFNNQNYIPNNILGDKQYKNYDIYENQVVINFLRTIIQNCDYVSRELSKQITNKNEILKKQINIHDVYSFSILTLKSNSLEKWQKQLDDIKCGFHVLWVQYSKLFSLRQTTLLKNIPHTTKVFQEVIHYRDIFDAICKWFKFGEFSIARINAMLKIKTMDTLYEYYCLYQILEMLTSKGWTPTPYKDFSYYFNYGRSYNEDNLDNEICNTFCLQKDNHQITLYYQPKIFGWERDSNEIKLFRTTIDNKSSKQSFWQPDFVIKIKNNEKEKYVILDAKYANKVEKIRLPECIEKYINQISCKHDPLAVKMMGLLQGKPSEDNDFINYNNSQMSEKYYKGPIIGVIPLSTKNNFNILYNKLTQAFDIQTINTKDV